MILSKFNNAIETIFSQGLPNKIGVALSGGIDSMCLTSLLQNYITTNSLKSKIYPITINHNLRLSSSMEIPLVRKYLQTMGLDTSHYLHKSIKIQSKTDAFEEVARIERYKALNTLCEQNGIEYMFLAHHLDDQLETFVMRLLRNSGIFGLNAMNYTSKSSFNITPKRLNLVRPMIDIQKNEIYQYCFTNDVQWVQDLTNFEEINHRNTIRKYLNENEKAKKDITRNFYKVRDINTYIENQVNRLHKNILDTQNITTSPAKLTIKFTKEQLELNSDLVLSRLLFKSLYPISPSLNYHYSFHKVLETIPKLSTTEHFSLLQLQWNIQKLEDGILISIKRQNLKDPITKAIVIQPHSESRWLLFDNRFWFKFKNSTGKEKHYQIRTLMKNDKNNFTTIPKDFKYSKFANLPVLIDMHSQKIISILTEDENHDIQWTLKQNIYTF